MDDKLVIGRDYQISNLKNLRMKEEGEGSILENFCDLWYLLNKLIALFAAGL